MLQKGEEYYRTPFFVACITFQSNCRSEGLNSETAESLESGRMCLFLESDQHHDITICASLYV